MAPFRKGTCFLGLKSSQAINGCSKTTWGMTLLRNDNPSDKTADSNGHPKMAAEGKWQSLRGDVGGGFLAVMGFQVEQEDRAKAAIESQGSLRTRGL